MVRASVGSSPRDSPLSALSRNVAQQCQRHPFAAKTVTSAIGFAFGDFLTQLGTRPKGKLSVCRYDYVRTTKMAAAGALIAGPVGLWWLQWLGSVIQPNQAKSKAALTTMVVLDQVLGCAIWQAAMCSIDQGYRQMLLRFCSLEQQHGKQAVQ